MEFSNEKLLYLAYLRVEQKLSNSAVKDIITWPIKAVIIFNGCSSSLRLHKCPLSGFRVPDSCKSQTQLLLNSLKDVEVLRRT